MVTLTRGAEQLRMTTNERRDGSLHEPGPGDWTVTVTREGLRTWTRTLAVSAWALADLPVSLAVAGFAETVQVESDAADPTQIPLKAPATGGSRLDIPVRDLPASLFMVGQALIQERGARSVEEAVQLAVGMQASTGVGSIPELCDARLERQQHLDHARRHPPEQQLAEQPAGRRVPARAHRDSEGAGVAALRRGRASAARSTWSPSRRCHSSASNRCSPTAASASTATGVGINVPLRRNLFARVDVSQSGSDGYVGDSPQKLVAGAASIRWLPTSNVSIKGSGTYTYDNTSLVLRDAVHQRPSSIARTRDINYNMEDRLTKSHNKWLQVEGDVLLRRRLEACTTSSSSRPMRSTGATSKAMPTTPPPRPSTCRPTS